MTGVTTVTVVDLSGGSALRDALQAMAGADVDGRLRLLRLRLSGPAPWLRATGLNAAVALLNDTAPSRLLTLPCDISLAPDFVTLHPAVSGRFHSTIKGEWNSSEEELGPALLFLPTFELLRERGFDERLQWVEGQVEDVDLHRRLQESLGLLPLSINSSAFTQQPGAVGAPTLRAAATPCGRSTPLSAFNCSSPLPLLFAWRYTDALIGLQQQPWEPSLMGSELRLLPLSVNSSTTKPPEQWVGVAHLAPSLDSSLSSAQRIRAVQEAAVFALERFGLRVSGLDLTSLSTPSYLVRLLTFYAGPPSLIIHVQHGLSNRLRAFASALAVATSMDLRLKLIWVADSHCGATFSQLLRLPALNQSKAYEEPNRLLRHLLRTTPSQVWEEAEEPAVELLAPDRFDVYHYVDPQGRALDVSPGILPPARGRHVYVRSASRLNHSAGWRDADLHLALVALNIGEEVKAVMDAFHRSLPTVDLSQLIGVHIRQRPPQRELQGLRADVYSNQSWAALSVARAQSSRSAFEALIASEVKARPFRRFYIAADSADILERLESKFGFRVIVHLHSISRRQDRGWCEGVAGRSVECLRIALADQLLLSQTKVIHGSYWSAFSEVAGLWRNTRVRYNDTAVSKVRGVLNPGKTGQAQPRKGKEDGRQRKRGAD